MARSLERKKRIDRENRQRAKFRRQKEAGQIFVLTEKEFMFRWGQHEYALNPALLGEFLERWRKYYKVRKEVPVECQKQNRCPKCGKPIGACGCSEEDKEKAREEESPYNFSWY